jgi:DNA polymerase-3 subunit delta'
VVRFEPLATELVSRLLIEREIVPDEKQARELAEQAAGSLQKAVEALAMNFKEYQPQLLRQFSGNSFDHLRLVSVVNDFVADAGTEAEAKRHRLRATFHLVTNHFREVLRSQIAQESPNRAPESRVLAVLDRCIQAEEELDRNANQATLLECWVDDLGRLLDGPQSPR